jgi:hypothetical protein
MMKRFCGLLLLTFALALIPDCEDNPLPIPLPLAQQ